MLTLTCQCGAMLRVEDKFAGQKVRCPSCKGVVDVPGANETKVPAEGVQAGPPAVPPPLPKDDNPFAAGEEPKAARSRPIDAAFKDDDAEIPRRSRDEDRRRSRRDDDDDDDRGDRRRGRESSETSGKAVASLILGVGGYVCIPFLFAIPGFILGLMALGDIKRRGLQGKGMAISGLVLSVANFLLCGPALLVALLVPAVQKVREAAARTQAINNAKMVGLAFHAHNDFHKVLPGTEALKPGTLLPGQVSWRVGMLPFIEQDPLYRRFAIDQPFDSPQNQPLLREMPMAYTNMLSPAVKDEKSETVFQIFTGPDTPFRPGERAAIPRTFTDGTSNTFIFAEASTAVPWSKVADNPVQRNQPLALPPKQFIAAFADGSVRVIDRSRANDQTLRLLINPADGMPLPPFE